MGTDHRVHAAVYDRLSKAADAAGMADRRRRLLADARGVVLEVGAGTGLNLRHYGPDVEKVVALEPDASMRRRMEANVTAAPVPVEVRSEAIDEARLDDESVDTVVCTLVLCSVPDQARSMERIGRVLRPGGYLLFLEHVRDVGLRKRAQQVAAPVWRRVAAGCNLDRDTVNAIRDAGFTVTDCDRFRAGGLPHVQGRARHRLLNEKAA
jgi:SAM-dependent methyltransferase